MEAYVLCLLELLVLAGVFVRCLSLCLSPGSWSLRGQASFEWSAGDKQMAATLSHTESLELASTPAAESPESVGLPPKDSQDLQTQEFSRLRLLATLASLLGNYENIVTQRPAIDAVGKRTRPLDSDCALGIQSFDEESTIRTRPSEEISSPRTPSSYKERTVRTSLPSDKRTSRARPSVKENIARTHMRSNNGNRFTKTMTCGRYICYRVNEFSAEGHRKTLRFSSQNNFSGGRARPNTSLAGVIKSNRVGGKPSTSEIDGPFQHFVLSENDMQAVLRSPSAGQGTRIQLNLLSEKILAPVSNSTLLTDLCFIEAPAESHDSISRTSFQPEDLVMGESYLTRVAKGTISLPRLAYGGGAPRSDWLSVAPQAVNNNSSKTLPRPVFGCQRRKLPNFNSSFPKRVRPVSGSSRVTFRASSAAGAFQRNVPTFNLQGTMSTPYTVSLNILTSQNVVVMPSQFLLSPPIAQLPSIRTRRFPDQSEPACSASCQRYALMMTHASLDSSLKRRSPIQSAVQRIPQRRLRSLVGAPSCLTAQDVAVVAQPFKHSDSQSVKHYEARFFKHPEPLPVSVQDCSSELQSLIAGTIQEMQRYHPDIRTSSRYTNSDGRTGSRSALCPRCGSGPGSKIPNRIKRGVDSRRKYLPGTCMHNLKRVHTMSGRRSDNLPVLSKSRITDIKCLSRHKQRGLKPRPAALLQIDAKKQDVAQPLHRIEPAVWLENEETRNSPPLMQVHPGWNQDVLRASARSDCGGVAPACDGVCDRAETTPGRVATLVTCQRQGTPGKATEMIQQHTHSLYLQNNFQTRSSAPTLHNQPRSTEKNCNLRTAYTIESSQHCSTEKRQPIQRQELGIGQASDLDYSRQEANVFWARAGSETDQNKNYQAHEGGDGRAQPIVFSQHAKTAVRRDNVFPLKPAEKESQKESSNVMRPRVGEPRKHFGLRSDHHLKQPRVGPKNSRQECESGHQRWRGGKTCSREDPERGVSEMISERLIFNSGQPQGRRRLLPAEAKAGPMFPVKENTTFPQRRQRMFDSQVASQEDSDQRNEHLSKLVIMKKVSDQGSTERCSKKQRHEISRQRYNNTEFEELEKRHNADNNKRYCYAKERVPETKNDRKDQSKKINSANNDSLPRFSKTQKRDNSNTMQGRSAGQNRSSGRDQIFLRNNSESYDDTGIDQETEKLKHGFKIGDDDTTSYSAWCSKKQSTAVPNRDDLQLKPPFEVKSKGPANARNGKNISSIFDSSSQASWSAKSQEDKLKRGRRLDKTVESLVGGMLWDPSQRLSGSSNAGNVPLDSKTSASSAHTTNVRRIDWAQRRCQVKRDTVSTAKSDDQTPIERSDSEVVNIATDWRATDAESSRMIPRKHTNTKECFNSGHRLRRENSSHRSFGARRLARDPGKYEHPGAIRSTQKTATTEWMPTSGYSCPPNTDTAVSSSVDSFEDTSLYLETQSVGSRSMSIPSSSSMSSKVSLYSVTCSRTSPFSTITPNKASTFSITSSFQNKNDSPLQRRSPSKLMICASSEIFRQSTNKLKNTAQTTKGTNDSWSVDGIREPESDKHRRGTNLNVPHRSFKGLPPPVPQLTVGKEKRSNFAADFSPPQGRNCCGPPKISHHRNPRMPLPPVTKAYCTSPSRPMAKHSRVLRTIPPIKTTEYAWQRNPKSVYDSPSSSQATGSVSGPRRDKHFDGLRYGRVPEHVPSPPSVIFDGEQISIVQIVSRSRNIERRHLFHPDWENQGSWSQMTPPRRAGDFRPNGRHTFHPGFGSSGQSFAHLSPVSSCRGMPEFSYLTSEQKSISNDARWPVKVAHPSSAESARASYVHADVQSLTAGWPVGFQHGSISYEPFRTSIPLQHSNHTNARVEYKPAQEVGGVPANSKSSHSSNYAIPLPYYGADENPRYQTHTSENNYVGSDCSSIKDLVLFKGQTLPLMKHRRRYAVDACGAVVRTPLDIIDSEDEQSQDCSTPPNQFRDFRTHEMATPCRRHSKHNLDHARGLESASKDSFSFQVGNGDRTQSLQHTPCKVIPPPSTSYVLTRSDSRQSLCRNLPFKDPCRPGYRDSSPACCEACCVGCPRFFLQRHLEDVQFKAPKANTANFVKSVNDTSIGFKADAMTQTGKEVITETGSPAVNHFFILPAQTQSSKTGSPQQISEAKIIMIDSIGKHTQDPQKLIQSRRNIGVQTEKRTKNKKAVACSPLKTLGGKSPLLQRKKQSQQKSQLLVSGPRLQESMTRTEIKRAGQAGNGTDPVRINRFMSTVKGRPSPANKTSCQGSTTTKPREIDAAGHPKAGKVSKARQLTKDTSYPAILVPRRRASNLSSNKTMEHSHKLHIHDTRAVITKGVSASLKPRLVSPFTGFTKRLVTSDERVIARVQSNPSHFGKNSDHRKKPATIAASKEIPSNTTAKKELIFGKRYSSSSKIPVHPKLLAERGKFLKSHKILEQVTLRTRDALFGNKTFNRCLDITPVSYTFHQDAAALLSKPCPDSAARLRIPGHIHVSRSENLTEMCDIYQRISPKATSRAGPGYSTSRRGSGYPTFDSMAPTRGRVDHMFAHNPESPNDCYLADYIRAHQQPCVDIMRTVLYPQNDLHKRKSASNVSASKRGRAFGKGSRRLSTQCPSDKNHLNMECSDHIKYESTVPANTHIFKNDFRSNSPQRNFQKEFTKGPKIHGSQVQVENPESLSISLIEVSPFSIVSLVSGEDKLSQDASFYWLQSSSLDDQDILAKWINIHRKVRPSPSPEDRSLDLTSQPEAPATSLISNRELPRPMIRTKSFLQQRFRHGDSDDNLPAQAGDDIEPPNLLSQCPSFSRCHDTPVTPCHRHRSPSRTINRRSSLSGDVYAPSLYLDTSDDVSASAVFDTSSHVANPAPFVKLISSTPHHTMINPTPHHRPINPTPHHKPINPTPHHKLFNPIPHHKPSIPTPHHKPSIPTPHHAPINPTPHHSARRTDN